MSRSNAAPTHGWIISSQLNKWLALILVVLLLIMFITAWTITYTIRRDCSNYYHRDMKVAGYWVHIQAGSTAKECPQP